MINAYFDTKAFMQAVDQVRATRGVAWHHVWHETGIEMTALRRMRLGRAECSIHTLTTLVLWSGIDVHQFMKKYAEVSA